MAFRKANFIYMLSFFLLRLSTILKAIQFVLRDFIFRHKCRPQRPLKQITSQ